MIFFNSLYIPHTLHGVSSIGSFFFLDTTRSRLGAEQNTGAIEMRLLSWLLNLRLVDEDLMLVAVYIYSDSDE